MYCDTEEPQRVLHEYDESRKISRILWHSKQFRMMQNNLNILKRTDIGLETKAKVFLMRLVAVDDVNKEGVAGVQVRHRVTA